MLLKGLTREYATFVTMVKFSKDKKDLEELKRDLINFEFDNKTNRKEESAFNVRTPIKCFTCGKVGHKSAVCRNRMTSTETRNEKCFKCGKIGHLSNNCRGSERSHKFCSNCKIKGHELKSCYKPGGGAHRSTREATNYAGQKEIVEEEFSFFF